MSRSPSVWQGGTNARRSSAPEVSLQRARGLDGRFVSNGVGFEWQGMTLLDENMVKYATNVREYCAQVAEELAPVMESYMRANATWRDRTGEARKTMKAIVTHDDRRASSTIQLAYGVFYGVFLENKTYGGVSYAIIGPTIAYFAPQFLGRVKAKMP